MATVTKGRTFTSGETVTPTKLNELVDLATVTNIQTADIANGAVTNAKLGNDIVLVPAGAVMPFAMNSAPTGWLAANGSAVSRTTYATLFAAIGTTHGAGDGSTTFNLPDLRGYFIRGTGTNSDGTASGTFAAKQAAAMLNHTHSFSGTTGDDSPDHYHDIPILQQAAGGGGAAFVNYLPNAVTRTNGANTRHTHTFSGTTGNPSTGGGTETRPANIALLYCIKF